MRLKYLDVLKAFAILSVVLYHSGFLSFGYLGVDLFLVINGYLLTKSLCNKLLINGNDSFAVGYIKFEISRINRLLPILLLAGVVCMALGFWVMLPDDYENLSETVVATNLFGNNILAAITTKNYWDVVNEYKPLMHTWYVGLLMQFYVVYPFLFYLAKLDKKNPQRTLLALITALSIISIFIYFTTTNVATRFYYLPSRFFEFAVGGVAALLCSKGSDKNYYRWFIYICYALLFAMMLGTYEVISAKYKLLFVVALSLVLVMSGDILENRVTANGFLANIGAASYSIYVWHQVLLAFFRYSISSHFTIISYSLYLVVVAIFSWLTYQFIEKQVNDWVKNKKCKLIFSTTTIVVFIGLTGFANYIYSRGGVVRDVPELYISNGIHINHKEYNDKIYKLDKPFETDKRHWLVVGNSFGRDFANVILESPIADSVEVSYIYIGNYKKPEYVERFVSSNKIFLSSSDTNQNSVNEMESVLNSYGVNIDNLVIVGTKNFGVSNGRFYINRNRSDYFEQRTKMEEGFYEKNESMKKLYGNQYLDLIGLVIDEKGTMPVFTPNHYYVSQDCRHFSKGGAIWFSRLIDWSRFFND